MAAIASGLYDFDNLPPIHVTDQDYRRLRSLIRSERGPVRDTALRALAHELDRACVCPATEIPPDAVTLGTRVIFRADTGAPRECRTLVNDETHCIGGTVSTLTPLGTALLGLRAGSTMPYLDSDGRLRTVSVESIVSQPEAPERALRSRHLSNPYADPALRQEPTAETRQDRVGHRRPAEATDAAAPIHPVARSPRFGQSGHLHAHH
jgi:regulator of nucleoside diphosphate kinase